MQNSILYLAHSDLGYINECRFSLLKYLSVYNLKPPVQTAIVVYTDRPQLFEIFLPFFQQFHIQEITAEQVKGWQGDINYVHRAKTEVIKNFFQQFGGNLIFFDTDTYITQPVEALWNEIELGTVFMQQSEGVIDSSKNGEFRKWDAFLKNNTIQYNNQTFQYSPDFEVWNSGLIGIGQRLAPVFDDVLHLTDAIHSKFPKHITEQVSCSYILQQHAALKPAADYLVHYWNLKEFRKFLNVFFKKNEEESIPNLVKLAHPIDAAAIQKEKETFDALPVYQQWLAKLRGKSWNIDTYIKKL